MYEMIVTDDFDLDLIAESGQCFRWKKLDENIYRIPYRSKCLDIYYAGDGRYELSCDDDEFDSIWRDYFDLETCYADIRTRINKADDPFLFGACEYGRGIRILRQDPWETLISFIISQNRNIPAIKKSIELLCEAAGKTGRSADGNSYYVFPAPEDILSLSENDLSECRLGYRCRYVHEAAKSVAQGDIDLYGLINSPGVETINSLTSICGVGAKVANCVSLFGLHHIDAFPIDVWIKRILENEYPDGYPMEKYSPYNGVYQQYMFYYYRDAHE
ncbi:MAG: hypothetical protein J5819_06995 [Eubacterium sp.]|nr:hypothetical protein [Eubacterium sp.]